MLNGSVIQFVGDSTSSRAARQLSAYLMGHPFEQVKDRIGFNHVLHDPVTDCTFTIRFKWAPLVDDLQNRSALLQLVRTLNDSQLQGIRTMVPTGTPELPPGVLPLPSSSRHVLVFTLSSHDIAFDAWNWENVGERPLNKSWLETTGVAFAEKWSRKMAAAMHHASAALHPENDIMVVRLPIAQACLGSKWKASCGLNHDIGNTFIAGLSHLLDARLGNISAGALAGTAPWGVDIVRLPTVVWTRAPEGLRKGGLPVLGRHPCLLTDSGGTHFATETGRMAHVQQLLHSISLTAADRSAWRDTAWFQNKFSRDAGLCPDAV